MANWNCIIYLLYVLHIETELKADLRTLLILWICLPYILHICSYKENITRFSIQKEVNILLKLSKS